MVYRQVIVLIKRAFFLGIRLFFGCIIPVHAASLPSISAECAVLYDTLDGSLLYGHRAHERHGMASTTKIMTALVALEQYDLEQAVTIRPEWCGIEGSSIYLKPGETLSVSDLLYGLLLESGNDAATALAGLDPDGSFVEKMNLKARELGLKDTHFDNPSGLDGETHYTTAYELAKLTAVAMENPAFAEIVSTQQKRIGGRTLNNHNRLLSEIGACGVKTGYTMACGRCLVSAKEQDGRLLICVTLNDRNDWADHKALYAFGFGQLEQTEILGAGDCGFVPLISSAKSRVRLYCNESFSASLSVMQQENLRLTLCGPRFYYGTVVPGQQYGTMQVWLGACKLFETPVFFAEASQEIVPEQTLLLKFVDFIFRRREH